MRRRHAFLTLCAGFAVGMPQRAGADDPPPVLPPAPVFAAIDGDPDGAAARIDREAMALLDPPAVGPTGGPAPRSNPAAAAAKWMALVEQDPDALLLAPEEPSSKPRSESGGTWWRAREVALLRLASLPEAGRRAAEARWGQRAQSLLTVAVEGGRTESLEAASRDYPVTDAGSRALLLLLDVQLERGDAAGAARSCERWLRMRPFEPRERRASVAVRLADALADLEDAPGAAALLDRHADLREVPVMRGGIETTLSKRVGAAAGEIREALSRRARSATPSAPPPSTFEVLWTRSLSDPRLLGAEETRANLEPPAAVAADPDALFLCEDRCVRRLDPETGLERWVFPRGGPVGDDYAPEARYRPWERPLRSVVRAGRLVLALLGDPPMSATSEFKVAGERKAYSRECRARLVALDAETGALVWLTGGPGEKDPVIGAPDVACTSPPLVIGDRVVAVFASRRGAVDAWLATFDLATGRVLRTTFLATGESGRTPPMTPRERGIITDERARSVPPAEAPVLSHGEICVVANLGFAAGVDAADGRVRWLTALPRYAWEPTGRRPMAPPPSEGLSARNTPVFAFGSWYVAASDSPGLAAIEARTGRLRWVKPLNRQPSDAYGVRSLLGASPSPDGTSQIRAADSYGRLVSWTAGTGDRQDPSPGDDAEARVDSGVLRSGDLWFSVDRERLVASAASTTVRGVRGARGRDTLDMTLRGILRARDVGTLEALESLSTGLMEESASLREAFVGAASAVLNRLAPVPSSKGLGRWEAVPSARPEAWRRLLEQFDRLRPRERARLYGLAASPSRAEDHDSNLVMLLSRWIEWGDAASVEDVRSTGGRIRSDLLAASLLPLAAESSVGRKTLAAREDHAAVELAKAAADSTELAEAVRRQAGTAAAWIGRLRLLAAHIDAGRFGQAASACADARLDSPPGIRLADAPVSALRALEGDCLAKAGEREAARAALFDARAFGETASRTSEGDYACHLDERLRQECGLVPTSDEHASLRLRRAEDVSAQPTALANLTILEPRGAGASEDVDSFLVAHGVDLETWSVERQESRPVPAEDDGWFGTGFEDREPFVPGPGVILRSIVAGQPADLAGLRDGDWILRFGGHDVGDTAEFIRLVAEAKPGVPIAVDVRRMGEPGPTQVVPARRPADRLMRGRRLSATTLADGTAVVPSRYGLRKIDPRTGEAKPLWRSRGRGDIVASAGFAGTVYAVESVFLDADAVVAVEASTGRERWRTAIDGDVMGVPRAEGSALVIDAKDPARTLILDRETGSIRASILRMVTRDGEQAPDSTLFDPPPSAAAGGFVYVVREGAKEADRPVLYAYNTTTGALSWQRALTPQIPASSGNDPLVTPLLAAGGFVAVGVASEEAHAYVPDLRGGVSPRVLFGQADLHTGVGPPFGDLDRGSRMFVEGDTLYLLRTNSDGKANVSVVGLDRRLAVADNAQASIWIAAEVVLYRSPRDAAEAGQSQTFDTPYWLAAKPSLDGVWVVAAFLNAEVDPSEGRAAWIGSGSDDRFLLFPGAMSAPYTQGPARVGRRMLIPTDEGAMVVPLSAPRR